MYQDNTSGQERGIISDYEMQLYFILDSETADYEHLKKYIQQKESEILKKQDVCQSPQDIEIEIRGDNEITYKETQGVSRFQSRLSFLQRMTFLLPEEEDTSS
jgi:hypothetical protein